MRNTITLLILLISLFTSVSFAQTAIFMTTNNEIFITADSNILGYSATDNSASWSRPSSWPIGTTYTTNTWIIPETNVVKWVTMASHGEVIRLTSVSSDSYSIDWHGDGTVITNYSSGSTAIYDYPSSLLGKFVAVRAYTTNKRKFNGITLHFNSGTTSGTDQKAPHRVEMIYSGVDLDSPSFDGCDTLESLYIDSASITASAFTEEAGPYKKIFAPSCTMIKDSAFSAGNGYGSGCTVTYFPVVTNIQRLGFYYNQQLESINFPLVEYLGNSCFYGCVILKYITPMPNLKAVGTTPFDNCAIGFDVMTNVSLNLPVAIGTQTLSWAYNPGSVDFGTWYRSGTVSNDFLAKGWRFTY